MKNQDLKKRLINRRIKKPNWFFMSFAMAVLGFLCKKYKVRFNYDYDKKSLDGHPVILLSSHASRLEFIYTVYGFGRKDINIVCGYQNIMKRGFYNLFIKL